MPNRIKFPLLFLLAAITTSSYSQHTQSNSGYPALYHQAEKLFNKTNPTDATDSAALAAYGKAAHILESKHIYNDTLVDCWEKSGVLLMTGSDPQQALAYFLRAIDLKRSNPRLSDSLFFKAWLYAGSLQFEMNNPDTAIYFYKKAENIYSDHPGLAGSERLFNKLGVLYFETGDYNKSISYFEKALSLVQRQPVPNLALIVNYQNNIATALLKLGRYDEALEIFRQLLGFGNPPEELLFNIANTYFEKSEYRQALQYLRQVKYLGFEKLGSLIKIFIRLHQYDSAKHYLNEANLLYRTSNKAPSIVTYGMIQKYSGDLKAATGNPMEALSDYQSSIVSLDPSFKDESPAANPVSFSGFQNFSLLFDALVAKATLLKTMGSGDIHFLEWSVPAYTSAFALARHVENIYFSDDARLILKNKVNPATRQAVDAAIKLYDKTKNIRYRNIAFGFIENNKATVLQAGLKNLELTAIPGLPAGLVAQEKNNRALLAKLEIEAAARQKALLPTNELQVKIRDAEISLGSVQEKLDENPLYHELKFSGSSVDLEKVQKEIRGSDEAILSYYYTDSNLVCFYITKNDLGFTSVPLKERLFSDVSSLRKELVMPEASGGKYLREMGISLFQMLLAPVFNKIENKKHITIIPYNEISYIPFEMLINPRGPSLMVEDFFFSYNYSAGFLSHAPYQGSSPYIVLAMSPFSEKNESLVLPALPASVDETADLPGKTLSGSQATKQEFENLSPQFPVIHLATHAVANDTNLLGSYIAFYGLKNQADSLHRLYEQEIYTLDLKTARLAILSACETGDGLLVNGEGIMSLSRAFSYAGCKSVITSLWKADELSTSFIIKRLHEYLQKGIPIDASLQRAKLDYIGRSDIEERYKTPAYWAHLVLIGNTESVSKPAHHIMIEVIVIAVFIFITIVIIKKTRHKNIPGRFL